MRLEGSASPFGDPWLSGQGAGIGCAQSAPLRAPDVRYEPTPMDVVHAMLRLAKVNARDVVYDLGSGDGRVVTTAARRVGARGVCVEIDPQRLAESEENARQAGIAELLEFRNEDLFATRIADATVVALFLSPELNVAVRSRLVRDLKPGTRIVSHWHDMGDWTPEETVQIWSSGRERSLYLWTIPEPCPRP